MILRSSRPEGWSTAAGLLLLLPAVFLSALPATASTALLTPLRLLFLARPAVILAIEIPGFALLGYGLVRGCLRHKSFSPLLFATLGAGMLLLAHFFVPYAFLFAMSGLSLLAGGLWDLFLPSIRNLQTEELPTIESFLNSTSS